MSAHVSEISSSAFIFFPATYGRSVSFSRCEERERFTITVGQRMAHRKHTWSSRFHQCYCHNSLDYVLCFCYHNIHLLSALLCENKLVGWLMNILKSMWILHSDASAPSEICCRGGSLCSFGTKMSPSHRLLDDCYLWWLLSCKLLFV